MSVINTIEISPGRDDNFEWPADGIVKKQYKRVFQVTTDNATDDGGSVVKDCLLFGDIPRPYTPYITPNWTDNDCLVKQIAPSPTDSQYIWTITVHYDNEPFLPAQTPLCLPPVWSLSFTRQKEAVQADVNGNPVLNSALIPIALERETSILNVQIKWCSINFFWPSLVQWQDTVNDALWNGFQPGTCKLDGFTVTTQIDPYRAGLALGNPPGIYYEKNISIAVKWEGHQAELLDAGTMELNPRRPPVPGQRPNWLPITIGGQVVTSPVPLDGFGHPLPFGRRPVYKTFEIYRSAFWGNLVDWPSIACPERPARAPF